MASKCASAEAWRSGQPTSSGPGPPPLAGLLTPEDRTGPGSQTPDSPSALPSDPAPDYLLDQAAPVGPEPPPLYLLRLHPPQDVVQVTEDVPVNGHRDRSLLRHFMLNHIMM